MITAEDARACGWSPSQLRAEVSARRWHRLRRGVFVEAALYDATAVNPQARHRLEVAAAVAARSGSVASHGSAAALWGLDRLGQVSSDVISLTQPSAGEARVRRKGDLDIHQCQLPPAHRSQSGGVATTTAARTVVDLARTDELMDAVVVMDSALRRQRTSVGEIAKVVDSCERWPGVTSAAAALRLADPKAESVFESVSRVELVRRGLAPETQCWLTGPDGRALRVDFLWWKERTVGEADGLGKYVKYGPASGLDPLQKEKLRQELLEEWGFEVVRWSWHQMRRDPDAVAARVRRGFARSALRQEIRARNAEPELVRRLAAAPWDLPDFT